MATVNMTLTLPTVSVTAGPTYATQINTAFDAIDEHDHTSGKGVQIPSSGLNINATLQFNDNAASELTFTNFTAINPATTIPSTKSIYVHTADSELYYKDGSGNPVQLTSGGFVASTGGTGRVVYSAISSTPYAVDASNDYSKLFGVDTSTAKTITLPAASNALSFTVKDVTGSAASNNITITPNTGDAIESGATNASFLITENYGARSFVSDGATKWYVF